MTLLAFGKPRLFFRKWLSVVAPHSKYHKPTVLFAHTTESVGLPTGLPSVENSLNPVKISSGKYRS
jgi:hypothetical protein